MSFLRRRSRLIVVAATSLILADIPGAPEAGAAGATQVVAGHSYACALTDQGGVMCWGKNEYGERGDGTTTLSRIPVPVTGLASGGEAISARTHHTCAVTDTGAVMCWGENAQGQVGDGTMVDRRAPTGVVGLTSGIVEVAAGGSGTCALTDAGGVKCWGYPDGDGDAVADIVPVDVVGLTSGVQAIAAGWRHACALTDAGDVTCWGSGPIGDGTTGPSAVPVEVVGLPGGVVSISAGDSHACAVTGGGAVWCWGENQHGQLGDGTQTYRRTPVKVLGLSDVVSVAAGNAHTCAVTTAGSAACWGWNHFGRLGDGTTQDHLIPAAVPRLSSGVVSMTAGAHTCAVTSEGGVKCWGPNRNGQLGNDDRAHRYIPVGVWGLPGDPGGVYRPDGEISPGGEHPFVGAGTFNGTGEGQTVTAHLRPGEAVRMIVRFHNRSAIADTLLLTATHRDPNVGVHYVVDGMDVTDRISGTRSLRRAYILYPVDLGPHERVSILLKINAAPEAAVGASKTVQVRAVSAGNARKLDVVAATVTVRTQG